MSKASVFVELDVETGELHVEGPWNDGILFLGLLEMGKLAFLEGRMNADKKPKFENKIVVPQIVPPRKM